MVKLINGDCLEKLRSLPDNSIDSIVTDPPYGLSFMGKKWDYDVPSTEIWAECLRVLKPGGHLLAFFGTRTYHRGAIRIEDAGFEIRDQIQWLYGSGFPKSMDISKAIDKAAGVEREVLGKVVRTGSKGNGVTVHQEGGNKLGISSITAPATDEAKQWQGWGTALKPANEPIVVARKPLEKGLTVAENVLKWGTGALNIDGSRVGNEQTVTTRNGNSGANGRYGKDKRVFERVNPPGRWPANIMFDEEAAAVLGEPSRFFYVAKASKSERNKGLEGQAAQKTNDGRTKEIDNAYQIGSTERQNFHPTVKPIKLMQYLIKLVTPPNGIVLDPFMGSGSTGVAAKELGFGFVGCELSPEYFEIAKKRIGNDTDSKP